MKLALSIAVIVGAASASQLAGHTRPSAAMATIGVYPGYTGSMDVKGTVVVQETDSGVHVVGTLSGLEDTMTGGIHVHTGFTCDDAALVGGHYFGGDSVDPWLTTSYLSNAMGAASVDLSVDGFTLGGEHPVANRAFVVHASNGDRVGCGVLMSTVGEVVTMGTYPGYTGTYENAVGTLVITNTEGSGSVGVSIVGTLAGLEASQTGGIHVHSGYTCDDADGVGGHYYDPAGDDAWTATEYTTDANGAASVSLQVDDYTLDEGWPVAYRAVVAHLSAGSRAMCGLAGTPKAAVATLGAYPGYTPGLTVTGTVVVEDTADGGVMLTGTVGGLEMDAVGGIHVHTGVTCADAGLVGGHYYSGMDTDPWGEDTTYSTKFDGSATLSFTVEGFSLTGTNPVAGRAVVVHASNGDRVACGLLESTAGEVASVGGYPGYAGGLDVGGTFVLEPSPAGGVRIHGTAGGLEASSSGGGMHVHSGFTIADASGVAGHYFEGDFDAWNAVSYPATDAAGAVAVDVTVPGYSMRAGLPVSLRAFVLHASSGTRIGAGLVSTAAGAAADAEPFDCFINECGCPGSFSKAWCSESTGMISSSWCLESASNCVKCSGTVCFELPTDLSPTPSPTPDPAEPDSCYISVCGCPGSFAQSWCSDSTAKITSSWCNENESQCNTCSGAYCTSA